MTHSQPHKAERVKAVAYIRTSTDKQELSPDAQREIIVRWSQLNDIKIVAWFQDVCTGSMPWIERQELPRAVDTIKRQGCAWLVVAKIDRLSRDLWNQLHLQKELSNYEARTIAATETPGEATPEKELMNNMLGSFAQFEKAQIRRRIKDALAVRKRQGIRLGGIPLEGTELGRCIVWAIWHLHDQGVGTKRIAKTLNEAGAVGPRGGQQHERNVQRVLRRDRPTALPRAWRGDLAKTFKQFRTDSDGTRRESNTGDREHTHKTWGCPPRASAQASDPAEEQEQPTEAGQSEITQL